MRMTKSGRASWACAFLLSAAALAARPASATVKAGDQTVKVGVGAAVPLSHADLSAVQGPSDASSASTGLGLGGQYLYQLTPAFGFGGEFSYADYGNQGTDLPTHYHITSSYKTWAMEAVARYVLMPDARVNPYFIAGLGLGSVSAKADTSPGAGYVWSNTGTTESRPDFDGSAMGPEFSVGLGADADLTDSLVAGLDARWRFISVSKTFDDQTFPGYQEKISSGNGLQIDGTVGWKFGR